MHVRDPTASDGDRIAEVVESAMTASYRLSPQGIDRIVQERFGRDAIAERIDDDDMVVRVAETRGETEDADQPDVDEPLIVGYVEGVRDGDRGELRWLFVDPEHRGEGIGEELFETGIATLEDAGAEEIRATTLEENAEGEEFFEHFDYARVDDRRTDVAGQTVVEYVYAPSSADDAASEGSGAGAADEAGYQAREASNEDDLELPNTETKGEATTATTGDGQRVYLDLDERESGTESPFFPVYYDRTHDEQHGYYCSNCGSLDVAMDTVSRMECQDCGNDHAARSGENYDDSYL